MKNKLYKQIQKEFTRTILRPMNKNISEDPLWKGRYVIRQTGADLWSYPDGPGGQLWVHVRLIDKKTGKYEDFWDNFLPNYNGSGWRYWKEMNDFIINSGVWDENPRPTYDNTPDYRNVLVDEKVLHAPVKK